ncbi:hypothetical protein A5791_06180 [Mycobacterium sp. 852002-51163_SCH5372311]|nr:hypothetical protein A5791_06180 [Mycobacterium sp. 852002-51163_SCH5372311]
MVIITPGKLDQYVLDYHLRELYQLDGTAAQAALDRLVLVTPSPATRGSLAERVLMDPQILDRLDEERKQASAVELINWAPSAASDALALRLGVEPEEGPYEPSVRWGSKSGGKKALRIAGVFTSPGPSTIFRTGQDVEAVVKRMAQSTPRPRYLIIKLNDPSWGNAIGNAVIDCAKLLRDDISQAIEMIAQPWEQFVQEIPRYGAIVEHYLTGSVCSPSGQGYIDRHRNVLVLSTHDQYVIDDKYSGCSYPASNDFASKVRDAVVRVGKTLSIRGVHGHYGVDFIGFHNGELIAMEINIRKVGPTHVFAYTSSLVASRAEEDGQLRVNHNPVNYVHRRLHKPDLLSGVDPRAAVEMLKSAGLHFNHETKQGVILHVLGALQTCGFVELTCVAYTSADAIALRQQVENVLLGANLR